MIIWLIFFSLVRSSLDTFNLRISRNKFNIRDELKKQNQSSDQSPFSSKLGLGIVFLENSANSNSVTGFSDFNCFGLITLCI